MKKSRKGRLIAVLPLVFLFAACSSGSSEAATESVQGETEVSTSVGDDTSETTEAEADESAPAAPAPSVPVEIFFSDEGAGCAIYVSVDESVVTNDANIREMLWRGLVSEDVRSCDFSEVEEVGLITVQALDEYEQPDWSSVIEHSFYAVDDWSQLVEQCFEDPLPEGCDQRLETLLTK